MADHSRLEDLRRRVEKDPASIAFAQLAEEYRRNGDYQEAVQVCRGGLEIHPGYLSARVTLGRALLELNDLDGAQAELEEVLRHAPENLAAIRGLADIHHRHGHLAEALAQYRAALAIARNDPDLERTVEELSREVEPQPRPEPANGLSLEQMHRELAHAPSAAAPAPAQATELPPVLSPESPAIAAAPTPAIAAAPTPAIAAAPTPAIAEAPLPSPPISPQPDFAAAIARAAVPPPQYNGVPDATRERAQRTITALEQWLDALNGPRSHSRA